MYKNILCDNDITKWVNETNERPAGFLVYPVKNKYIRVCMRLIL